MRQSRIVVLSGILAAGLANACGGGSGGAGADFCQKWADAFCQKAYSCTTAADRATNGLLGSSQAQCVQIWDATCTMNQPDGETFDVNCSGGAHVNSAAETACFNELSTITCDTFNSPDYTSVCDQVCTTGGGTDAGTGGTTGTGGTGGTSGTGGTGGGSCGNVQPCGGSVVGTWTLTNDCADKTALSSALQSGLSCPSLQVSSAQAIIAGTLTFGSDGTYSVQESETVNLGFSLPSTCTSGLSCTDFGTAFQSTCAGTTTCACTETNTQPTTSTGTYSIAGNVLALTDSATLSVTSGSYCVQGSTLHLLTVDSTTGAVTDDTVAQKQ